MITFLLAAPLVLQDAADGLPLLDHEELRAEMQRLAAAHATVTVETLGLSREGRVLEALVLDGAAAPSKPALLLVANLDGPDVFASAVALAHARDLAAAYGTDERATELLDGTRLYLVPRANPDAAEAWFQTPRRERTAGGRGVDDDRDGRSGEDSPADVDGDGLITTMRVPDPDGAWMEDPSDPRASVEADPLKGERGRFRLEPEGLDADGDERVAEDAPGDTVVNRNFPAGWREHAPEAGLFPSDEPEARALMELVLQKDDVALVLCYGPPDNLIDDPKTVADDARPVKRVPPAGMLASDAKVRDELARRYAEITSNEVGGGDGDHGTFQRWCYEHRGLLTLSTVLWEMPQGYEAPAEETPEESEESEEPTGETETPDEADAGDAEEEAPEREPSVDAQRLEWVDGTGEAWRFVDWHPFDHPTLGAVEIGGFAPHALYVPPTNEMRSIAEAHLEFLHELGRALPRVSIAACEAEPLGGDLWRVTATVENASSLPLLTRAARRARTLRPARLTLDTGEGALVAGPRRELLSELDAGERHETTWLVRTATPAALQVELETTHAGRAGAAPEVKR